MITLKKKRFIISKTRANVKGHKNKYDRDKAQIQITLNKAFSGIST